MQIQGFAKAFEAFKKIESLAPEGVEKTKEPQAPQGKNFASVLGTAIDEVDQLQKSADSKVDALTLGRPGVTPHEAMIALEKADMAFQLMNTVRSKIIRAYEEVMRSQV